MRFKKTSQQDIVSLSLCLPQQKTGPMRTGLQRMKPHRQHYHVLRMQPGWLILPPIPDYKLTGLKPDDGWYSAALTQTHSHYGTFNGSRVTCDLKQSLSKVQAVLEPLIVSQNLPQQMQFAQVSWNHRCPNFCFSENVKHFLVYHGLKDHLWPWIPSRDKNLDGILVIQSSRIAITGPYVEIACQI